MSIHVLHKNSFKKGVVPEPKDLATGQLGLQAHEGEVALYTKDTGENIVRLSGTGSGGGIDAIDLLPYELKADSEARDKDLQDQIDDLEAGAFDDAPVDGKQYVRKDADWEEVTVGTGDVEEAPQDGTPYSRQDGTWVSAGSEDFEEPPADDEPYVRSTPSIQADPSKPIGSWLKLNHTDPNKLWLRKSTDPNFGPSDGVHENDLQYVTDTDKLFIYRDVFEDGSAYFWTQCLHSNSGSGGIPDAPANGEPYVRMDGSWQKLSDFGTGGGGPFVNSVAVTAPLKDDGSNTSPNLGVDLTTLPSSS